MEAKPVSPGLCGMNWNSLTKRMAARAFALFFLGPSVLNVSWALEDKPTHVSELVPPCSIEDVRAPLRGGYRFTLVDSRGSKLIVFNSVIPFDAKLQTSHGIWVGSSYEERIVSVPGSEEEKILLNIIEDAAARKYGPQKDPTNIPQDTVWRCIATLKERAAIMAR